MREINYKNNKVSKILIGWKTTRTPHIRMEKLKRSSTTVIDLTRIGNIVMFSKLIRLILTWR